MVDGMTDQAGVNGGQEIIAGEMDDNCGYNVSSTGLETHF